MNNRSIRNKIKILIKKYQYIPNEIIINKDVKTDRYNISISFKDTGIYDLPYSISTSFKDDRGVERILNDLEIDLQDERGLEWIRNNLRIVK